MCSSDLGWSSSDPVAQAAMLAYRKNSIPADAVAGTISFALRQSADVDINEIIVRPVAQR